MGEPRPLRALQIGDKRGTKFLSQLGLTKRRRPGENALRARAPEAFSSLLAFFKPLPRRGRAPPMAAAPRARP